MVNEEQGKTSNPIFYNKLLHIPPRLEYITVLKCYFLRALTWLHLAIKSMTLYV